MSLYKQFKTDDSIEKDGILLDYGVTDDGKKPIRIRIARAGGANVKFTKRIEAKVKPYRRQIQNETIETAVLENILKEVYADTVILGWENVSGEDGKILPFKRDNVIKVLTDLPDLFRDIQDASQRAALFRTEIKEDDAKN